MNEEALQVLYSLAQAEGYSESFDEFKSLMSQNEKAVNQMYSLAQAEGYEQQKSDFDVLVGYSPSAASEQEVITEEGVVETDQSMRPDLKKKDVTESVSADGLSEQQGTTDFLDYSQMVSSPIMQDAATRPLVAEEDIPTTTEELTQTLSTAQRQGGQRYFEIDGEYVDLLHPDGDKRRENIDRYQAFLNQQEQQEAQRLKEEAEAMTAKVVGYDKFTGRPIYESKGMPLIKFDAKEEKEKREAQKKKISKIKRFTEGDKEKYDSYNPLVNASATPLKVSQQKGYLPGNVEFIPKAADIVKLGLKPVVPFDMEAYRRDEDLYAMMYDAEVETYKNYLKDKAGYVRAADGRYYNPENFNAGEIFNNKINKLVNQELIEKEEEAVSMMLSDELSPFGFKVDKTGTFTDRIIVTAPNGQRQEFSLNNFFDDTDFNESVRLKAFLKRQYAKELTGGNIPRDIYGKELSLLDIDVSPQQNADIIDKLTSSERRALDLDRERVVAGQGQLIYESDKEINNLNAQLEDTNKKIAEAEKLPESYKEWRGNVEVTVKNQERADRLQFLNKKKSALEKKIDDASFENRRLKKDKPINPVYKEFFSDNLDAQIQTDTEVLNEENRRHIYLVDLFKEKEDAFLEAEKQALALAEQSFDKKTQTWKSEEAERDYNKLTNVLENEKILLNKYGEKLLNEDIRLKIKDEQLTRDVGRKAAIQAEIGELGDSIVSAIVSGTGSLIEGGTEEFAGNIIRNINNMFYDETDEEYITDEEMNDLKKQSSIKKDWVDSYGSWADLTPEAMQAFRESLGVASIGFYGALESSPAMLLSLIPGGRALAPLGFSFLSAQNLREQMDNNPDFDYMSENDKLKFIAPMAFTIGLLENYGVRNVMRNSSFLGKTAAKLAGKGPTSKTLNEISDDLGKNYFQREFRKYVTTGLGELETEAMQEALDIYGKEYMDLKMKNNFWDQDVRFFKDEKGDVNYFSKAALSQIIESGMAGFFGGLTMKAPSTIVNAIKGNKVEEIDDFTFMFYEAGMESPTIANAQRAQINNDIASGKITKEQGDEMWNTYTRTVGQMREVKKVAGQYDTNTKKKLLSLLMEKKQLEEKIDGVDKSLTREEQRKIKVAEERIQETLASGETKLTEDKAVYEQAKKDGYKGTFEQHRNGVKIKEVAEQAVEQEVKKKKPVKKAPVVEETTVTEEAAPVVEQTATQQEALETQPITKITNDLVTKEKKGELTQEETDGILLGIMEKIEAENAKRKTPLSPEQAQKKLGKMQQRVFEANKDRYLELSGVMPAAQEQVVEEAPVKKEAPKRKRRRKKPVVKEAPVKEAFVREEPIEEEELEFGENTFVYKMSRSTTPSGRGRWESDFEIIDNRPNEQGIRNDNTSDANWMVLNKITGEMLEATSKKDAQGIIKNAPAEAGIFGEGQQIDFTQLTPSQQKKFKKQFETQKVQRKRKKIGEKFTKKLSEESAKKEAPVKKAPKKTTKKKAPVKEEAKISEEVQKEIDRAERLKEQIVVDKENQKTRLSRSNLTREQRSERREELDAEIRQTEKKYNNIITELKEGKRTRFRLSDDAKVEAEEGFITEDAIVEVMKGLGSAEMEFKIPVGEKQIEVDPIALSKSLKKITDAQAKKLGFKSVADMLKNIEEFNGIPMVVAMSDILAAGIVKDSMGNDMEVGGGLLYNVLGPNKTLAWAGVNKDGANTQFEEAKAMYRANKELFDRLWKEGKLPKNHVPMVVVRMDNAAINSNEAMFRFMAPKLKSFPKKVQKIAFDTFLNQLESKKKTKSVEPALIEAFIKKNKIKDLGTLFDLIVEDAKKRAKGNEDTFALTTKGYILDMIASPVGVKKASKPVAKAIMNATDYNGEIFLIDHILSKIGETSMVEGERGDAVAIMGVDVSKNGGVTKAKHNNYGFGPKGRLIALIKNPTNVLQIFPEWRTKAFKMFEVKPSTGEMKTDAQVLADVYGQVFGDKAFRGSRLTKEMSDIDMVSAQMRFAFPSVSVSQSQQEFDEVLKQEGIRTAEANGNTILGLTKDGKIFLNPSRKSLSTPIHEFGHIWIDYLRSEESGSKGSKLLERGLELVEGTKALESAIKKYGDNALAREEALVELMGTKGETIANAAKRAKFVEWFNAFFKYIKEKLTRFADIKAKDIKDITLEEFVDIGLAELFSGEAVDAKFKPEEAAESAKARMQKEGVDFDAAMNEAINDMIDKGFKAAEIKGVLLQMGYKARAINDALVVKIDADMKLPNEFANIEGGVKEGEAMFRSVMEKLKEFAAPKLVKRSMKEQYNEAKKDGYKGTLKEYTEEQNNKKVEMLKQANASLVFFTNEEILKRYPNIQNQIIDKRQKSRGEIRAKAVELLEAEPAFQAQDNLTQLKLIESMDRTMKTRSNKSVQKKINAIKQTLKGVREGVKDLQAAKKRIKNFINEELLSIGVSTSDAKKLVRIVEKATKETYESSVAEVMQVVEKQTKEKRKSLLEKMGELAKKKSKGKKGAARTSPEAARFFKQAAVVIEALKKGDTKTLETLEEDLKKEEENINEILDRLNDGEKITPEEQDLIALAQAFDILGSLNNQDISEVQDAFNLMKSELESGMESLRTRRAARKVVYDRLRAEAEAQIKEGYEFLFNKNGKPLSDTELNLLRGKAKQEMWNNITNIKKLKDAVTTFYRIESQTKGKFSLFSNSLKNLGTLLRGLDRKGNFFEKNVFERLNNMEEDYLQGYFNTMDFLESELNAIGIEGGIDGLTRVINDGIVTNEVEEIKGILVSMQEGSEKQDIKFTKDMAMRVYALSKNAEQMERLEAQGFNNEEKNEKGETKMQQIERFLGPQLIEATDLIVNYLSTSYYESINEVYENVNDVSLPFIENYFPTKTVLTKGAKQSEIEKLTKEMNSGNFSGTLSAQTASALKERSSQGAIDLSANQDFTSVLEEHFRTMERFKAYAMGTKEINIIMNHTPSVKSLLDATRLGNVINKRIMYAINPNAAQQVFELQNPKFSWFQRKFVGVTLALKLIQLPKQATSFVNAFADYKLRQQNRIPGVDRALDLIGFIGDTAYTLLTFRSSYKQAMKSASFRNRIRESFKTADLLGLEQGTGARARTKKTKLQRALRKAKVVVNSPTLVGDIMGVMGYMSAYRANMRNGMSQEEAIEKFNAYNETQQTRRPTDKIGIQISKDPYARAFTMFGSTLFLQLNKVMQSYTNIRRGGVDAISSAFKGDMRGVKENFPKAKDTRELYLNIAVANLLFVAMSNVFKYNPFADDDEDEQLALDRAEVMKALKEASTGMNILYNLPLVGPTLQQTIDYFYWENPNAFSKSKQRYVNPIEQLFRGAYWEMTLDDMSVTEAFGKSILSLVMGVNVDKPLALYDRARFWFGDDDIFREGYEKKNEKGEREFEGTYEEYKQKMLEENFYELFGISYSYRPGSGKDWTKKKMTITVEPKKKEEPSKGFGGKKLGGKTKKLGGKKIGG